ncbi:hypothetical protein R1CP_19650 [Rhodococcus opacus]|uniref:Uncharacterized protein n=1 Tax=Rhodococcus opacus TaxID=37919 RepID=A0A1B1K7L0_RHOOP|nr:acetate--CoA ligase family protein [Rhodococcus opacus]ANS28612.1 hypothetical protein R1CP_19650 [Rhodococcus opacus]
MIDETIASHMLLPILARKALARFLVRVGDIVAAHPEISELDLNPVTASDTGIVLVDVRIILSKNHPGDHTKLRQGRTFPATEGVADVAVEELRELLVDAWRMCVPKKVAAAYEG